MKKDLKIYKKIDFPPLTDAQKQELENLKNLKDEDIDFSDIPRKTNEDFAKMQFYYQHQKNVNVDLAEVDKENATWIFSVGNKFSEKLNQILTWARIQNCPILVN